MSTPLKIARLNANQSDFAEHLDALLAWEGVSDKAVNDRVEELIVQARTQKDLADRRATYGELQEILIDEVPRIIPLFQLVINGMGNNVRGLESDPGAWFWARYAWFDE